MYGLGVCKPTVVKWFTVLDIMNQISGAENTVSGGTRGMKIMGAEDNVIRWSGIVWGIVQ